MFLDVLESLELHLRVFSESRLVLLTLCCREEATRRSMPVGAIGEQIEKPNAS